ncbi:MAG: protein kinase domain-containing protein, partial [Gemmataceae bacterium]
MTNEHFDEKSVFNCARGMATPHERMAYLQAACAQNPDALQRILDLLRVYDQEKSFLESPPIGVSATADEPVAERPGTVIGPYKLLEQIGEGGMGTVWMAQQTEPVKRLVALKLIKAGMDSRQVIARFEAERQALALMDHPNIARVLDAGTSGVGRPYFVMDLVKGVPITRYCDLHHLTPRQRLELFIPICLAIQHAHQKGIIHRDLKPSNVLVALYDGKPVPKVIDFGVAKAAGQPLTDKTLVTGFGAIVGTLEYMSPEQAEINQLDIDTRSDIYSLGVLLYELLAGSPPFSSKELQSAGMLEMLRVIREKEPSKPSTKLSSAEGLPTLAANRGTEPAKLTRLVRGELDWIVMKALEKDRNRRYETANGFAMDVQRYLADEAVQACSPSAGYRLRKFVRRNKRPVLAASVVLLVLVAGIIGTTWGMLRATHAEGDAVREAGEKTMALGEKEIALATATTNEMQAKAAKKDAQENLKDALAAVEQMLTRVAENKLVYVPQMEPIRRDLLLDALKFYQKFLERQSADPVIRREAALAHRRVAGIHSQLGQYQNAERAYRHAFEMFDTLGSSAFADPALLREIGNGHIEFSWMLFGLGKDEEARQNIRRAVELADKLDKEEPLNRPYIFNARNNLAGVLRSQQPEEAEKILKGNLALGGDAQCLAQVHGELGGLFMATGRLPQAEEAFRQAVTYVEQLAAEHPSANWVQFNLATYKRSWAGVISANQRPGEAEEIQRSAVLTLEKLASDFPNSPAYRRGLADAQIEDAGLLKQLGQTADAEMAYRRAIDLYDKLATDFPTIPSYWQTTFDQRLNLGQFLKETGRVSEASRVYQDAGSITSKLPSEDRGRFGHRAALARTQLELGQLLAAAGKKSEAQAAFAEAVAIRDRLEKEFADKAEFRRDLVASQVNMGNALKVARRLDEAIITFRMALSHWEKLATEFPHDTVYRHELAQAHGELADLLPRPQAEQEYRKAVGIYERLVADT